MNKRRWIGALAASSILLGGTLQAATITNHLGQLVNIEQEYINTSDYNFAYINVPGFLISPLQEVGELLASFNEKRDGYTHEGIDIRASMGTPIFAVADGVITKAAPDSKGVENGGGHMIFLDLGNGAEARYMHLGAYGVKAGDRVKAGQVIGFTGSSGDSTTPHLHFEYRIDNQPIDPAFIFETSGMIKGQALSGIYNIPGYMTTWQSERFYVIQE